MIVWPKRETKSSDEIKAEKLKENLSFPSKEMRLVEMCKAIYQKTLLGVRTARQ